MRTQPLTLRAIMSWITLAILIGAMIVSGTLVIVAHSFDRAVGTLTTAIESKAALQDTRTALRHLRGAHGEAPVRVAIGAVRASFDGLAVHVSSAAERDAYRRTGEALARYLDEAAASPPGRTRDALREEIHDGLDELGALAIADARAASADARGLDRLAIALAAVALLIVIAAVVASLRALRRGAGALAALGEAMERYGAGDRDARAAETGLAELRDMARRFNAMAESIEEHRRERFAFLGGIAHDLRSPLTALGLALDALADSERDPAVHRTVTRAANQLRRIDRMVDDVLELSRSESGALAIELGWVDVREVVAAAAALFDASSDRHPVIVRMPDEPLLACCDRVRLEQVVGNLVGNAIKYSPAGGAVEVSARRGPGGVEIAVRDHGIGLTDEDRARLFQPFGRGRGARRTAPGTGLGLFVARRIVDAHGGAIDALDAPDRGTIFRLVLPQQPRDAERCPPPPAAREAAAPPM